MGRDSNGFFFFEKKRKVIENFYLKRENFDIYTIGQKF